MRLEAVRDLVQGARPERAVAFPVRLAERPARRRRRLASLILASDCIPADHLACRRVDTVAVLGRVSPAAVDPVACRRSCLTRVAESGWCHRILSSQEVMPA